MVGNYANYSRTTGGVIVMDCRRQRRFLEFEPLCSDPISLHIVGLQ